MSLYVGGKDNLMVIKVFQAKIPNFGFTSPERPDPVWPQDYQEVANVYLPDITEDEDPINTLELAYRFTNSIEKPWVENANVDPMGPAFTEGRCRSSSVGDIFEIKGKRFKVVNVGFDAIDDTD